MDKQSLRSHVFDSLRKNPQAHFHTIEGEIRQQADGFERHDALTLQEVLWELLVQGILAPGKNSMNLHLPFVHVTEYGATCLDSGSIIAHDPEGYMHRLHEHTQGRVESGVVQNAAEGLRAYLSGHYLASTVMLARAAAILLSRLTDTVLPEAQQSGRDMDRLSPPTPSSPDALAELPRILARRELPDELAHDVAPQIASLSALLRRVHSEDGTARTPHPSRDDVLAHYLLFPDQCRFVYALIDDLEVHRAS